MAKGKRAIRTKAKLSDGSEHVTVTLTESAVSVVEAPPQTTTQAIAREDQEDEAQALDLEKIQRDFKLWEVQDKMTMYLKERFNLAYLMPEIRYKDSRFPKDVNGFAMSVNRIYLPLKLIVDKIPASWTEEMILAKKWAIEQLGFKYCWVQDGENPNAPEVYERTEPLTEKPSFEFKHFTYKTQFHGTMNLVVS